MQSRIKSFLKISTAIGGLCALAIIGTGTATPAAEGPPKYKYDSDWPKPLPNHWALGGITGLFVDKDDHIWVLNRPRDLKEDAVAKGEAECCTAAPAVLEFDTAGNLLKAWGKPDMVPGWPQSEHTVFTDNEGNVYIAGAQPGDTILKFTADGQFVKDFGHRGAKVARGQPQKQDNQETDLLLRGVAAATLDEAAGEIYIADGYLNKRVMVYDWNTGQFKRGWGAYGKPLSEISNDGQPVVGTEGQPAAKDFKSPVHAVRISKDGLVYVGDRSGNRIQVFTKQGKFLKEFFIARNTKIRGTAGSVDFSPDAQQKYVFVADIANSTVWELDRQTGQVVQRIGRPGREGGAFGLLHVAFMDSKGNIYTGEVGETSRVQKFSPVN
jgi:DNA-binding beta-propeller fold protein YncE